MRRLLSLLLCMAAAVAAQSGENLKIPEIVDALAIPSGGSVADIGSGDGQFESSLSRTASRVYAEDINEDALKRLRKRIADEHLEKVEVIQGTADDPKLPDALDAALMVIMYHEIENHQAMLDRVRTALKPGGRLVIVDLMPHKTLTRPRGDQTKNHVIAPDLVEAEVKEAGFQVLSRDDRFLDNPDEESVRWMIVFRKPPDR